MKAKCVWWRGGCCWHLSETVRKASLCIASGKPKGMAHEVSIYKCCVCDHTYEKIWSF